MKVIINFRGKLCGNYKAEHVAERGAGFKETFIRTRYIFNVSVYIDDI